MREGSEDFGVVVLTAEYSTCASFAYHLFKRDVLVRDEAHRVFIHELVDVSAYTHTHIHTYTHGHSHQGHQGY